MTADGGLPVVRAHRVAAAPTSTHPEDGTSDVLPASGQPDGLRPGAQDAPDNPDPQDAPDAPTALLGAIGAPDRDGRLPVEVVVDGWRFEFLVEDAARAELRERATRDRVGAGIGGGSFEIRAIIPGRVVAVVVAPGDTVEAGEPLLVVEAMKMQNDLRAPRAGSVVRVAVGVGATVDVGDVLVVLG